MVDDSKKYNDPETLKHMVKAVKDALDSGAAQELLDNIQEKHSDKQFVNNRSERIANRIPE